MTLGGTLIVRNAIALDYCLQAAIDSLLGVCDRVIVLDGYSDDGTWQWLTKTYLYNPRVKLMLHKWEPCSMGTWLSDLTNRAAAQLDTDMQINLQADETLHEDDYPLIRQLAATGHTYALERLNFWHDHRHLLRPHVKVGSTIVRLAPSDALSFGDAQGLEAKRGWQPSKVRIYHYGFIRKAPALAAKGRQMQQAFFGVQDSIWDAVEAEGAGALTDVKHATAVPLEQLVPYTGTHPKAAHRWLLDHGYAL